MQESMHMLLYRAFHAKTKSIVFSLYQLHFCFACSVNALTRSSNIWLTVAMSSLLAFFP